MTLEHQYRDQLPPEVRAGVDANCRNKIVFGLNSKNAKDMAAMAPELTAEDFMSLPRYQIYTSFQSDGKSTGWVMGRTLPPTPALRDPSVLYAQSMRTYGTPVEKIEEEYLKTVINYSAPGNDAGEEPRRRPCAPEAQRFGAAHPPRPPHRRSVGGAGRIGVAFDPRRGTASLYGNPYPDAYKEVCETSPYFLAHTLAVTEITVQLTELCREQPGVKLTALQPESGCWRTFSEYGTITALKRAASLFLFYTLPPDKNPGGTAGRWKASAARDSARKNWSRRTSFVKIHK